MKKILISLLFFGFLFAQSDLGRIDGQVKMQNKALDNLLLGGDAALTIATGVVAGISSENKFGRAVAGVQTVLTDIWDRADASVTDSIWVAPTQARIHAITSSSDADSVTATGARTIRVFGLTSWDTAEVSEVISLDGVTGPNTVNAYVIIHRMKVLTKGAAGVNVGDIIATAAVDGTVTAEINALEGQTQMAIYGVPSTQTAYMTSYYGAFNKAGGATVFVDMFLVINPEPDNELLNFLIKSTIGLQSTGSSYVQHPFNPYFPIPGPAIIKMQGMGSANDLDTSAGFSLILIDN